MSLFVFPAQAQSSQMDDSLIAARTERLSREIALIQQEERPYRVNRSHSLAENAEPGSFESLRSVKN